MIGKAFHVVGPDCVLSRHDGRLVVHREGVLRASAPLTLVGEVVTTGQVSVTPPDAAAHPTRCGRRSPGSPSSSRLPVRRPTWRNCSASAGAYFRAVRVMIPLGYGFSARDRSRRDVTNALINYCSALLRETVHGAILAAGLDPYLSFLHTPSRGRPTLAFDLMETARTSRPARHRR